MKINARLKKIGDLVEADSVCLDVGCDHALLDIYLVKLNKNIKAIASDIAEGPLEQAKNNIKREKLDGKIDIRLGAGLDTYSNDIDTVIISGMGGRNVISICKDNPKVLKKIKTLIVSPNNYQEDVKRYLTKNGFYISNEEFVRDKKFIYQIIIFKKGKKKYTKKEYFFGPIFLIKKGPLFREYYERELKSREILLTLLPKNYRYKKYQTRKEIEMIKNEIED
ncbi:MAG: SAM-dependent methyltransferase [Bacilli bacterium]|nr:SAM-dependent methyltransferase [Bacilli bacterium]